MKRLNFLKTVLWGILGIGVVVMAARLINGLGATTALNNATPWGLWIALDVITGVALAAGGFVIAATVYIFGLEKYRPFVRPAILTAFLGYIAVAVGLLYDLGLPWHIWHPMIYWQHHSVLFEVAMCVMLYLSVIAMEFAPVALEHPLFGHPLFRLIHKILKKFTILLVITGIVLSTLHQSSLGSLFLITPLRLHPLWYSPHIYFLFFVSAVGLGLMMVALESMLSGWFFGHKIRTDLLSGLGTAAACVLGFYAVVRLVELTIYGKFALIFSSSWYGALFVFELAVSAIIPAVLLAIPKVRRSVAGMATCASMTVFGMVLYRFDVCLIAFKRPDSLAYFPSWTEIAVSAGIISGAALVFIFFVENLKVFTEDQSSETKPKRSASKPSYDPATVRILLPSRFLGPRSFSLMFVAGAAMAIYCLPHDAIFGSRPMCAPVSSPKMVKGYMSERADGFGHKFIVSNLVSKVPTGAAPTFFLKLNGDRDGRFVLFPHNMHIKKEGGNDSCVKCHHMNMPGETNTSCFECHRDMYGVTDIFNHPLHIKHLGGNDGCVKCHVDTSVVKNRQTAVACTKCHSDMLVAGSVIESNKEGITGYATGYKRAMHDEFAQQGFCIDCHKEKATEEGRLPKGKDHALTRCDACHRDADVLKVR
jgi:Ni/Fe-hydrogenase subunit HybB-like protein